MNLASGSRGPTVQCPTCKAQTHYAPDNPWRPFCSQRCRSIDLGAWATESYRVASTPADDEAADPADAPEGPTGTDSDVVTGPLPLKRSRAR